MNCHPEPAKTAEGPHRQRERYPNHISVTYSVGVRSLDSARDDKQEGTPWA
jgi:hypothetical protein